MKKDATGKHPVLFFIVFTLLFCMQVFASPKMSKEMLRISPGETESLVINDVGSKQKVAWKSNKTSVVTVKTKGSDKRKAEITGKRAGRAEVTATVGKTKFKCIVDVNYVELDKSLKLEEGKSGIITLKEYTDNKKKESVALSGKVAWSSSNKKVATVSIDKNNQSRVKITAKKSGTSYISAKYKRITYKCKITVNKKTYKLSKTSVSIDAGKSVTIELIGASKNKVKWSSANKRVATVSSAGNVKGINVGSTTVTAKYDGRSYRCKVKVGPGAMVRVGLSETSVSMKIGETKKLSMSGASGKVKWSSTNKNVATVNSSGSIKAVGSGSAKIKAKYLGEDFICSVNVSVPKMSLNVTDIALTVGETSNLKLENAGVTSWISTNSSIVSVSNKGVIKGMKPGRATIRATSYKRTYQCSVTVEDSLNKLSAEERRVYNILLSFKKKYPEGTTFTNADYRDFGGGIYRGGYGCAGFTFELSDAAFGEAPARRYAKYAHKNPQHVQINGKLTDLNIRVGDILRTDNNVHSVIVLQVLRNEKCFIVAEGNFAKSVHWGRKISFSEFNQTGTWVITRYPN